MILSPLSHGALCYPLVYFTNTPPEELRKTKGMDRDKLAGKSVIGGVEVEMTSGGYLTVRSDDIPTCSDIANCIMLSASLLGGNTLLSASDNEFDRVRQGLREGEFTSLRNAFWLYEEWRNQFEKEVGIAIIYNTEVLRVMLEFAGVLYDSPHRRSMMIYYSSLVGRDLGDWLSASLLAWIAVEISMDLELRLYSKEPAAHRDAQQALKEDWGTGRVIGLLLQEAKSGTFADNNNPRRFDQSKLEEADRLRALRNEYIHEGRRPTKVEARRFVDLGTQAMWRFFRLSDVDYGSYLDRANAARGTILKEPP